MRNRAKLIRDAFSRVRQRIIPRSPTTGSRRLGTILASVDVFQRRRRLVLRLSSSAFRGIRTQLHPGSLLPAVDGTGQRGGAARGSVPHANSTFKASRKVAPWNALLARVASRIRESRGVAHRVRRAPRIQTRRSRACVTLCVSEG